MTDGDAMRVRGLHEPFDPLAPADAVPHAELAELRARCPVARTPSGYWYLGRYDDVVESTRDVMRFEGGFLDPEGVDPDDLFVPFISEPRHGQVRRVINAAIAAHRIGRIEEPLRALCDRLLDPIVAAGGGELVSAYIEPIPAAGIGYLLGLPEVDHPRFARWADALFRGSVLASKDEQRSQRAAFADISGYLDAAIAERAAAVDPADDFITRLVNTEVAGVRLSHRACRTQLVFLLVAGTETTRNLIGNLTLTLALRPDLVERLRDDASLVPVAIEESLRLDPPLAFLLRRCTDETSVGDVALAAGDQVAFGLASANRDESVFDDPHEFSLARENGRRHVAFGDGPHVCPGAALARLEARIAIEALVRRVTRLELAPGYTYRKTSVPFTNGPTELPSRVR